jgi:cytoskeletal protein RodZ
MSVPNASTTSDIGAALRAARETRGVSVEEAAWRTRIRPEYLRALEEERFDALGHHAHARGHLHSYARFLGLDASALVAEYTDRFEHAEPSPIERLNERAREARKPPKPKWLIAALLSTGVLIAASIAGVVRGPGPRTAPAGAPLAKLPASVPQAPGNDGAVGPAVAPSSVTVVLTWTGRSWVQATVDGAVAFVGTLEEGATKTFAGSGRVDLVVGNPAAVRLIVNGVDAGALGAAGSVYRGSFGPQGALPPQ